MDTGDETTTRNNGDPVAVLTADHGVMWARRPRWVTPFTPCVIDATAVRLFRWPMWSRVVPLELADRFDVMYEQTERGRSEYERLALFTRDRRIVHVQMAAIQWLGAGRRLPLRTHALHLNNHLLACAARQRSRRP